MRRPVFFLSFAAATSATAVARPVLTQGPPPGTVPGTSWSDTAVAESLKVLDQLNKTAERNNRNAAFWMRRAVVAWGLAYRDRVGPDYKGLDWTRLGRLADSSIRIALSIAPNDARVALTAAQFYLSSGQTAVRAQAPRHIERALKIARAGKDTAVLLDALIEQGRTFWRSYDTFANRRVEPEPGAFERTLATDSIMSPATRAAHNGGSMLPAFSSSVVERLNGATMPLGGDFGGSAYTQAEALFREAYKVAPADARAFHELAMLLTEHKRWQELANLARDRTRRVPKDASGWLALGLAMQRLKRFPVAAASFDTALTFLDARERAHFTSLRRVLPTQEEAVFDSMSSAEQARQAARYWRFADPLWSRGSSDAYVEFLARATYADLRWSVEELGVRGIDSDRGQMHVRYGPPDVEAVLGPNPAPSDIGGALDGGLPNSSGDFGIPKGARPGEVMQRASLTTIWAYDTGWLIIFRGAPTYATAQIPPEDVAIVDSLVRATPASWRNATEETIVSMPTQVARFRAGGDSIDVIVATEPPTNAIREQTTRNALIRADYWLFAPDTSVRLHDSSSVRNENARAWRTRVAPGVYAYRTEVTSEGAMIAGMSTDSINATGSGASGFTTRGEDISDVMLVARVDDKPGAARWTDLNVEPTAGTVAKNGQIALVWENYGLGQTDGSAKYGITITIERRYRSTLNRIRARVIGVMAAMVGVENTGDRVVYRYERSVAHAPVVLDYLTLQLEDAPSGDYRLTIDVTDHVTGKVMTRVQGFLIR